MKYLIRVRKDGFPRNGAAHLWDGKDTLCRMHSTGGISKSRTIISETDCGKKTCQMCASKFKRLQRGDV